MAVIAVFFFFNDTATTEIYTLSLHDALPILRLDVEGRAAARRRRKQPLDVRLQLTDLPGHVVARDGHAVEHQGRSEEHTSELQSQSNLVCRLLLEKKKTLCPVPARRCQEITS